MVLALFCALAAVVLLMWALNKPGWQIVCTLWEGAFGDRYRFFDGLGRSCPLILCGLAVAVAFRCRALNIGAEGQYVCGAMAATAVGLHCASWPATSALLALALAAGTAGAAWALLCALLDVYRHVPLVLSTILMNFVATGLLSYVLDGPLQGSDAALPESDFISHNVMLVPLVPGTDLHIGSYVALVFAIALWGLIQGTTFGFGLRAAGASPLAARYAGINVQHKILQSMGISGALAGLAGGLQIAGVSHLLHIHAAEGFGYMAIAVAMLGRLHPVGVAAAGFVLAMLDIGASHLERATTIGVPADLALVIKGVLILTVLAVGSPRVTRWLVRRGWER